MPAKRFLTVALMFGSAMLIPPARCDSARDSPGSILNQLASSAQRIVSTIPANGDVNPYGVAFVPDGFPGDGTLEHGDILVSNFNDSSNIQGTGSTIVRISASGQQSLFFQAAAGSGLTTALGVLRSGYVLVGNVPTQTSGSSSTVVPPGSLLVIDGLGKLVETLSSSSLLAGPWDLTIHERGKMADVFVSNVLSGTVTRLVLNAGDQHNPPSVISEQQIASGFQHRTDPAALVIGPTGVAYRADQDVLFVASTGDNAIFAIDHAAALQKDGGQGRMVFSDATHLHGPLGLAWAPNGNLLTANGDAVNPGDPTTTQNFLVEFTPTGSFVAQFQIDMGAPGGAFGLATTRMGDTIRLAAVDDISNTLHIFDVSH